MERNEQGSPKKCQLRACSKILKFYQEARKILRIQEKSNIKNCLFGMCSSRSYKKLKKQLFWFFWGKSMFWRVLGSAISLFQKNENHHLGRTSNAKIWNISWNIRFWWALGSVKTRFQFFVFCWAKMFSKRYRSNKDSVKIISLWFFHVLFRDFCCFFDMFCHDGLITKALGGSSNSWKIKFTAKHT